MNIAADLSHLYPTDSEIDKRIANSDYELSIDNFCGGGGASEGIEQALDRPIDIAINHDQIAIDMHKVNHPYTRHYNESVWDVCPVESTHGRPVGVAWFSPDCRHFSRAKGGKPVDKTIRGLAWVVLKWAGLKRPRVIGLENVPEFRDWGPLTRSDRVIKERKGETFRKWCRQLEALGYKIEYKIINCSTWGVPTSRTRLFLIARCDGEPIVWPMATHGPGLKKPKSAGKYVIDWSIPCPSIFNRPKELVENTKRRIGKGIGKYVINNPQPFILRIGQTGWGGDGQTYSIDQPLTTITSKAEHCIVVPKLMSHYGNSGCVDIDKPLPTITAGGGGKTLLVVSFLSKYYSGGYQSAGIGCDEPLSTVTAIDHHALVAASMIKYRGSNVGSDLSDPLHTISSQGNHHALVYAFLLKYYSAESSDFGHDLNKPIDAVTSKSRFALVEVYGQQYIFADIGMRMLQPHELYRAHEFPERYTITHDITGRKLTKTKQTAMVGNSVPPTMTRRLISANYSPIRNYGVTPIKKFKRGNHYE